MNSMRLALLGATFFTAAGALSAANAADVYAPAQGGYKDEPGVYLPAITWTGFYIGAHVGSTFEGENTLDNGVIEVVQELDDTGLAGFQIGYNWQGGSPLVLGIEGDMSFPFDEIGVEYFASVRGRLGVAAGNALFYATAGVAFLEPDSDDGDTVTGYTVGLGMDYKLRQNVSVGLEGQYFNFEEDDSVVLNGLLADQELEFFTVRARLNYHFGGRDAPLK